MLTEVLKPVLVIVIAFLLRLALAAIGVEVDDGTFNAIVAGIVTWLLMLIGVEGAQRAAPRFFK